MGRCVQRKFNLMLFETYKNVYMYMYIQQFIQSHLNDIFQTGIMLLKHSINVVVINVLSSSYYKVCTFRDSSHIIQYIKHCTCPVTITVYRQRTRVMHLPTFMTSKAANCEDQYIIHKSGYNNI